MSDSRRAEMIQLARALYGDPVRTSPGREMRFKKNESFSLNLQTEEWWDHQEAQGGGYRQLYRLVHGSFPDDAGDDEEREQPGPRRSGEGTKQAVVERWEPMLPPPPGCPPPTDEQLDCTRAYEYCDADDQLLYYVRRTERTNGTRTKTFVPLTYGRLWHGDLFVEGWHSRAPDTPRPLYRLNALSHASPKATVLLCEGEKATEAAQRLFPEMVAMCWSNGASAVATADFTPLQGRRVVIWPDADAGGAKAAKDLKGLFPDACVLRTDKLADGFDAADLELENPEDPEAWLRARGWTPPDPIDDHELPIIPWIDRRLSDWDETELPDRLWIVPDWIPREQVTGLYGPPGVNKTDFLIQLLMATALGLPFMGYQLKPLPVFGLFCEDTEVEIARRAARIARHYGLHLHDFVDFHYASLVGYDDLEFVTFDKNAMHSSRALKRFDMKIQDSRAAFACLDTAPHFFGGSEIDRRQVSRFLRKLDAISIGRSCGIMITAHPSARGAKAGGRMDSGSTGWEGGVRARIALTKGSGDQTPQGEEEAGKPPEDTNERTLTLWKSNYAPPGKTLDLVWTKGVFTTAALDPEKAKARGPQQDGACDEKFLELLRTVTAQGGYVHDSPNVPARYAPQVFASRPDGKLYSRSQYTRAMQRLLGTNKLRYEKHHNGMKLVEITTPDNQNAT